MIAGGAEAYFAGSWFRLKMVLLVIAVLFNITVFRAVVYAEEGRYGQALNLAVGVVALLLWFAVGWAGRAIAYF